MQQVGREEGGLIGNEGRLVRRVMDWVGLRHLVSRLGRGRLSFTCAVYKYNLHM